MGAAARLSSLASAPFGQLSLAHLDPCCSEWARPHSSSVSVSIYTHTLIVGANLPINQEAHCRTILSIILRRAHCSLCPRLAGRINTKASNLDQPARSTTISHICSLLSLLGRDPHCLHTKLATHMGTLTKMMIITVGAAYGLSSRWLVMMAGRRNYRLPRLERKPVAR